MGISLSDFVQNNIGKKLDIPGGSENQYLLGQCVSLVQQYLYQCFDIPYESRGHAKNWVNLSSNIAVKATDTHKAGDIIVWPNRGSYGHIGVVISSTEIFEQNVSPNLVAEITLFDKAVNRSGSDYVLMRPVGLLNTTEDDALTFSGYGLNTKKYAVNIRSYPSTSASVVTKVEKGNELKIRYFLDKFQGDNWQWAATYYNGEKGFSRVETLDSYTVVMTPTSVQVPGKSVCVVPKQIYLIMSESGGYIRTSIPSGSKRFIPAGTAVQIKELIDEVQSDGFQWVKATYDGEDGYIQADTCNWHYFKLI